MEIPLVFTFEVIPNIFKTSEVFLLLISSLTHPIASLASSLLLSFLLHFVNPCQNRHTHCTPTPKGFWLCLAPPLNAANKSDAPDFGPCFPCAFCALPWVTADIITVDQHNVSLDHDTQCVCNTAY